MGIINQLITGGHHLVCISMLMLGADCSAIVTTSCAPKAPMPNLQLYGRDYAAKKRATTEAAFSDTARNQQLLQIFAVKIRERIPGMPRIRMLRCDLKQVLSSS